MPYPFPTLKTNSRHSFQENNLSVSISIPLKITGLKIFPVILVFIPSLDYLCNKILSVIYTLL